MSFETFVAWRYLMTRELRFSKLAVVVLLIGLVGAGACFGLRALLFSHSNPLHLSLDVIDARAYDAKISGYAMFALAGLALFFGALRLRLTFFTVVPLGGVWIGSFALVCVLSVMSGFESDLRHKILGSNAHVQITREDGDFVEWHEIQATVDRIPGVLASTPFASSEVVIAANNNPMNVVIKGIEPTSIGSVTDLIKNLTNPKAMENMVPLFDDRPKAPLPSEPRVDPSIDPGPADLLDGADPIDFSNAAPPPAVAPTNAHPSKGGANRPGAAPTAPPAAPGHDVVPPRPAADPAAPAARGGQAGSGAASAQIAEPPSTFGGDAVTIVGDDRADDVAAGSSAQRAAQRAAERAAKRGAAPAGGADDVPSVTDHGEFHTIDVPIGDSSRASRRTQSLPGILVGTELAKQTNMSVGQEVRVVSPLSDPANPDATGTPIPFNRDYRVAGTFYTGMYEYDLKQVYVTLDSFQEFLDRGDAVDGIEVRVDKPDDAGRYVQRISAAIGPAYRVVDWTELNRSLFSALRLEKITMFIVLGIVILVASFSIVGNLIMVVFEKGREIALLKTLGATNWSVLRLFVLRGLMIGIIGTMLGVGMGLSACALAKRLGIPLNPDVYYIDRLPIHIDGSSVTLIAFAGVVISALAALYPAVLAIRIRPATGLRH
jgi:lipoprotein-releasing system permease protein